MNLSTELEYVGFWPRLAAAIVDLILLGAVSVPLLLLFYEQSFLVHSSSMSIAVQLFILGVLPPIAITAFWIRRHATPGKIAISAIIIDEKTAGPPSVWQHLGRYCAYFVSALPLGLGFLWVAFSPKKQAWHDRLAGTLVVRIRQ
ncbi:MAG: RDD family protein [Burkholderiaceae bacterium]